MLATRDDMLVSRFAQLVEKLKAVRASDRIPLGRLTLLVGRPGAGKSFLTCDMIARISRGSHWPEPGFNKAPLRDSLLIRAEDDPSDTIAPRLIAADADRTRIHLLKAAKIIEVDGKEHSVAFELSNVDLIRDMLEHLPECRIVVIDPIGSYLGGGVDTHRDNEVRSDLAPLAVLAAERGVAIVLVCHTRKAMASFADDTALGSRAFVGLARSVLHLTADEHDRDRKLLLPGKCNLSVSPPGLAFRISSEPARLDWEPEPLEGFHADDAMTENAGKESMRGPAPVSRDAAADWLRHGPVAVEEIKQQAKSAEMSWRTNGNGVATCATPCENQRYTAHAFSGGGGIRNTPENPLEAALFPNGNAKSNAQALDPALIRIIQAWPTLAPGLRSAVLAIVATAEPAVKESTPQDEDLCPLDGIKRKS